MNVIDSLTTVQAPAPQGASTKGEQKSGVDFAAMLKQAPDQPDASAAEKPVATTPVTGAETAEAVPEGDLAGAAKAPKDKKVTAKVEPEKKARKIEAEPDAGVAAAAVAAVDVPVSDAPESSESRDIAAIGGKAGKAPGAAKITALEISKPENVASEPEIAGEGKAEVKNALPAQAMAAPGKALGHEGRSVRVDSETPTDTKPAVAASAASAEAGALPKSMVTASDKPVEPGEATALLRLAANAPVTSQAIEAVTKTPGKAAADAGDEPKAADLPATANAAATQASAAPKAPGKAAPAPEAANSTAPAPATAIAASAKPDTQGEQQSQDEAGQSAPQSVRAPSESPAPFGLRSDIIVSAAITGAAGAGDIGSALGQQSIAIGTSGQWIDDIAREIASVSASGGHGSFQLASNTLGRMQVELTQGAAGTDIRLTVDNDAAEAALMADRGRLVQDAQLAAVRIGEVRIDRIAHIGDAQGGNLGNGAQGQNGNGGQSFAQSSGQSSGQSTLQQNAGQGNGQSARQNAEAAFGQNGGSNGGQAKPASVRAVSNDSARGDVSARADQMDGPQARYA